MLQALRILFLEALLAGLIAASIYLWPHARADFQQTTLVSIDIQQWPQQYKSEKWISVKGRPAIELAAFSEPTSDNPSRRYAYIPIVPSDYHPHDTIYCIACIGPISGDLKDEARYRGWLQETCIEGVVRGQMDSAKLFPNIATTTSTVCLDVGRKPEFLHAILFVGGLICCAAGVVYNISLLIALRHRAKAIWCPDDVQPRVS